MVKVSSASEKAKAHGFKSLSQVADIFGCKSQTLRNWNNNKPGKLEIILDGCLIKLSRTQEKDSDTLNRGELAESKVNLLSAVKCFCSISASSTNGSKNYPDAVRVYKDGVKVGEVFPGQRNPLAYLKKCKRSKYKTQLNEQLKTNGLTNAEFAEVYQ